MVSVASLLNPVRDERQQLPSPCSTRHSPPSTPESSIFRTPQPPGKRQKLSKDAPIFTPGKVHGTVRYAPWETYDATTATELQKFSIYPLGRIGQYHRHIPYSSDKKDFLAKTGRGAFEVFQYTFKLPGEDKTYTVMWDYNIGLVRITPFFKCRRFAKTVPSKMLGINPGLREICHSITGGALAAQGYWMPFEAAKAVAATFCYEIRYVLVPIFGPSFLSMCTKPGEDGYGRMIIDASIVQHCTEDSQQYKEAASREASSTPSLPPLPEFRCGSPAFSVSANWRPKTNWSRRLTSRPFEPLDLSNAGYYADTEGSETYLPSPQPTLKWMSGHQPCSTIGDSKRLLPSPSNLLSPSSTDVAQGYDAPPNSPDSEESGAETSLKKGKHDLRGSELPAMSKGEQALLKLAETAISPGRSNGKIDGGGAEATVRNNKETRAAYVLMQLHFADTSLKDTGNAGTGSKKRRASN